MGSLCTRPESASGQKDSLEFVQLEIPLTGFKDFDAQLKPAADALKSAIEMLDTMAKAQTTLNKHSSDPSSLKQAAINIGAILSTNVAVGRLSRHSIVISHLGRPRIELYRKEQLDKAISEGPDALNDFSDACGKVIDKFPVFIDVIKQVQERVKDLPSRASALLSGVAESEAVKIKSQLTLAVERISLAITTLDQNIVDAKKNLTQLEEGLLLVRKTVA
eukprot:GILI01015516.1.p1 GENE.GILI01015516.1~~GILI01015516.1.p1  ORF type:complete len:220 (-),score=59.95 GILI01015516.1:899-1558(-)